ncbi:EamA family transporter RarD [Silvanigrella aquatica]|uniref:EamA domain-containing protein n=1 Tax=Silvanigrella aquatica TaxID=1915309 RepID=A0A1L4D1M6_9BACT|nr:EamA family transporter RarD [Silvanigrella aquatica]APJ04098.1 hypothetical protein AXG55_09335 [Silvanigrella aquatica]
MKFPFHSQSSGTIFVVAALLTWGINPIYFKSVQNVSSGEILCHRIIWAVVFLLFFVFFKKEFNKILEIFYSPRKLLTLALTAVLISSNWITFIWAILNNHLMEASFGYFISPLFNILLGLIFLKEKLNTTQKVSLIITFAAIVNQFTQIHFTGLTPFVPIIIAGSFGFYTLLRKQINVESIHGFTVEALLLFPLAMSYIVYLAHKKEMIFGSSFEISTLLIFAGILTSIPTILYVAGSKLLTLSKVGFLQYICPTAQFIIAVFIFNEKINSHSLLTFGLIWTALILYISNCIWCLHKNRSIIRGRTYSKMKT